jgi:hypothetical protein
MSSKQKKQGKSDEYETYEEFLEDYAKYKENEEKIIEQTIRENRRELRILRWRLAHEYRKWPSSLSPS